jgi:hypothetical protein
MLLFSVSLSGTARGARKKRLANPGDLCYLALCRKRMSLKELKEPVVP